MSVSDFYQTFQCSNIERKESGNTDRLNRNLYVILKFIKRTKIPRITLKKRFSLKWISYLMVISMVFWMKLPLICSNLQRNETGFFLQKVSCIKFEFFIKVCQKQPSRSVLCKRCSENMQQIYRRTPIPKCDINNLKSHFEIGVLL